MTRIFKKNRKEESTWGVLKAENRFYYFYYQEQPQSDENLESVID